ncbi:MAG TPA: hypothetical protein VF588_14220 [Pyrinomonadaceae bacterium]
MPEGPNLAHPEALRAALELLSGLNPDDRRVVEARAESLSKLPPAQQSQTLTRPLSNVRDGGAEEASLDEHAHPSHVAEVLRAEMPSVQLQLLRLLPSPLAQKCAEALRINWPEAGDAPRASNSPTPEVLRVIRLKFMSHFASSGDLEALTDVDRLSGAELRRLVRFMGAREIAHACRRISPENVALFLRRFPPEDARIIASFIAPHEHVEPRRAAVAEKLVDSTVGSQTQSESMLNHIGIRLLAIALAGSSAARVRYTAQKIPYEAAGGLEEMIRASREGVAQEIIRAVAAEAEQLAAGLRQPPSKV